MEDNKLERIKQIIRENYNNEVTAFRMICDELKISYEIIQQQHMDEANTIHTQLDNAVLAGDFKTASTMAIRLSEIFSEMGNITEILNSDNNDMTENISDDAPVNDINETLPGDQIEGFSIAPDEVAPAENTEEGQIVDWSFAK